jgi:polysaccharide biosynthesis transport protein
MKNMELNHYFKIIWRRKLIIILTIAVTMVVVSIGTSMITPLYQASTVLRIATSSNGQVSYTDYMYSDRLMNTYIEIVNSRPVLTNLEEKLALTKAPVVKAEILPNTELIKITVEYTNPQIVAKAANTLADILIERSVPQYIGGNKSSQELLSEQLAQAKADLDQAQQAYNVLQAQILPDSQQLDLAKQSLQFAQNQYATLSEQYEQAISRGDAKTIEILAKQLTRVKTDLDQAQQTYDTLLVKTLPNSQKIDAVKQSLQLKQNLYATLIAQYGQESIRGETQANMMTVVETADVPNQPVRPQVLLNYALGLIAGLIGGLGLAFIFENLDTTLYTVEDVEAIAKLPAMANIPTAAKGQMNISQNGATSFAEAFRNLAISIQMTSHKQTGKALLFMSAEPAQGKSMIVYNLAFSLSEFGEKVVVVDCDLQLPKIHSLFGLANETGLGDILEKKIAINDALQETTFEGVKVLTSGSNPDHSSISLNSAQMVKAIQELKKQFDYILLDTPALLAVADVAAIAQNVDGLIEVVRRMHAKRADVQKASKFLAGFPDKFVGLIVNQTENNHIFEYYQSKKKFVVPAPLAEHEVLIVKE